MKPQRTVSQSLLSIALGLEATVVFFVALAAFGLKALPPAAALIGGAVFIVILILAARLVHYRFGVWLGWLLQGALIATGILIPLMYLVGAGFAAIWVFCFIKGRQLDAAKTADLEQETT